MGKKLSDNTANVHVSVMIGPHGGITIERCECAVRRGEQLPPIHLHSSEDILTFLRENWPKFQPNAKAGLQSVQVPHTEEVMVACHRVLADVAGMVCTLGLSRIMGRHPAVAGELELSQQNFEYRMPCGRIGSTFSCSVEYDYV